MAAKRVTKRPTRSTKPNTSSVEEAPFASEMSASQKSLITKSRILTLLAVIVVLGLLYLLRSWFVVALVNGQPISRTDFNKEVEKQSGKQVLNNLVTRTLIQQEANKQKITVTQKEVDDELAKIKANVEQSGRSLDQALELQGMTQAELREQIQLQKLVEKLIGKDVAVSDDEVNKYIEANKEGLPAGTNPDELKVSVKEQLRQQKLSTKFQTWIDDLQKKAKINYFLKV